MSIWEILISTTHQCCREEIKEAPECCGEIALFTLFLQQNICRWAFTVNKMGPGGCTSPHLCRSNPNTSYVKNSRIRVEISDFSLHTHLSKHASKERVLIFSSSILNWTLQWSSLPLPIWSVKTISINKDLSLSLYFFLFFLFLFCL